VAPVTVPPTGTLMSETSVQANPAARHSDMPLRGARQNTLRAPKASIGFYLVAMFCAVTLPVFAFAALLLAQLQVNERTALENRTEREAQLLATAVGHTLQEMTTTLQVLVTSPELSTGDLEAFHNRAQAALRHGSLFVILVDEQGQQRLNTRVPFGTPLGKTSNMTALEAALQTGAIQVTDVFYGATSQRWVFNVIMPLPDDLQLDGGALIITKNAEELRGLINADGLPAGWTAAVIDSAGDVVISSADRPMEADAGKARHFDQDLAAQLSATSGVAYRQNELGEEEVVGYAPLRNSGWKAAVWGPTVAAQASILTTWEKLIFGSTALLAVAIAAAIFLTRKLRMTIGGLAKMAEDVGEGRRVAPIRSPITEIEMVARALSAASVDRSHAEDQIRLMLGELAHRTKNQLAVTQAIINQTSRHSKGIDEFKLAITERIGGLGRSTDLLTATQWTGVPVKSVIQSHLANFLAAPKQLTLQGENFQLKPAAVQNLGLVLHELGTNATKHGALSVSSGKVRIEWHIDSTDAAAPQILLSWHESGGPPPAEHVEKGFGSRILERHAAASFRGKVSMDLGTDESGNGTFTWSIRAPLSAFADNAEEGTTADTAA